MGRCFNNTVLGSRDWCLSYAQLVGIGELLNQAIYDYFPVTHGPASANTGQLLLNSTHMTVHVSIFEMMCILT